MSSRNQSRAGGTQPKATGKSGGQKKVVGGESLESTIDSLQKLDLGNNSPVTKNSNKKAGGSSSGSKSKKPKKASGAASVSASAVSPSYQKKPPSSGPVLLGLPDTPMAAEDDVDPYVTKIGGVPNWLDPLTPAPSKYGVCESCGKAMFLLLQAYVPLEKSPYDRVIYVWACNQRKCMRNKGSFRVVRGMKLNQEYASKMDKKKRSAAAAVPAANPFGMPGTVDLGNALFGGGPTAFNNPFAQPAALGSNPFGDGSTTTVSTTTTINSPFGAPLASANPFGAPSNSVGAFPIPSGTATTPMATKSFASVTAADIPTEHDKSSEDDKDTIEEEDECVEWPEKPSAFQPHYLYITEEVLNDSATDDALVSKYRHYIAMGEEQLRAEEEESEEGTPGGASWGGEVYEEDQLPKGMDKALQKFTERVQATGAEQCVRYEFPGTPLLFSFGDATAKTLLPPNASQHSKHTVPSSHRIAPCRGCGGPRAFEMQLMPNMLSMLRVSAREHLSEEELASLKTRKGAEQFNVGMEWGTVLVYSCAEDCFSRRKRKAKPRTGDQIDGDDEAGEDEKEGDDNNDDNNDDDDDESRFQTRYYEEVALVQLEEI